MAKKISQLTQATEVKSDDVTVIVQDGETKKLPLNMMVTKQDIENKKVVGLAKLDEIEATYENDTYTPTITVKNKSSVKVGEGDGVDYSANVMDGHAKSAILSGQTLVNSFITSYYQHGDMWGIIFFKSELMVKDKKYVIVLQHLPENCQWSVTNHDGSVMLLNYTKQLRGVFTSSLNGFEDTFALHINDGETIRSLEELQKVKPMLIEYQEGMENWDIPYFTGMQSVKMPVLTTTGKNLFDVSTWKSDEGLQLIDNGDGYTIAGSRGWFVIPVKVGEKYTLTYKGNNSANNDYALELYETNNSNSIPYGEWDLLIVNRFSTPNSVSEISPFTYTANKKYLIAFHGSSERKINLYDLQLEESSTATSYEDHKTNILSTSEDLVLRGIGNVRDTLDCLTRQVTECIGEIVLDGSEDELWQDFINETSDNTVAFSLPKTFIQFKSDVSAVISDKYIIYNTVYNRDEECMGINANDIHHLQLRILKSKASNIEELKVYLSSNPIKVQGILETYSIKTVDLMPSGTHPSTTPYCWKNGHIQLSSSGLLPNLEYSVVTSRAGQINQNATMIVKNDKRIFDLEILLAGGLVNTTYQALTLQNQVETGLSKVSLNSEKEPDYLLYHMIMKLIEEKAYKLDDLTEKVSVFYLYEKLSDEQFETIYSELYPFVEEEYIELPEDGEIIEEPIVDEVLEEVENGVVM